MKRTAQARLCLALVVLAGSCLGQYRVLVGQRVVSVPVEDYVAGVVTGESGDFRSEAGLKAMAVAARTYAARMRGRHSKDGFDFCSTTHCQRFVTPASARAIGASKATAGELVWFDGKPALTVYSQSCGGRSEGMADFPYLVVHIDPYCKSSWERLVKGADIVRALQSAGLKTPDPLTGIGIVKRTESGRAQTLSLSGKGATQLLAASSFRFALGRGLGWNTIRSDLFEVSPGFDFRGSGEGNGIGLCQRGADVMGVEGKTYREILAFYYPRTVPFQWTRLSGEHVTLVTPRADADRRVLAIAELAYQSIKLPWPAPARVEIWVYPTVEAFRNATAEPGWVAARTAGLKVEMQPAEVLERRGALESTVRHEMLHVFVESAAVPELPVWFREGLVEWLANGPKQTGGAVDEKTMRQREDRGAAEAGYAAAEGRVAELVRRYGKAAVLSWVRQGIPNQVGAGVR